MKKQNSTAIPEHLEALAEKLRTYKKIVVLGVGSELMQDDNAGIDISMYIEKKYGTGHARVRGFTGYTTPENFTSDIIAFEPDHVMIVDAADIDAEPGVFIDLPVDRVTDFSLGTHKMSLIMMIKYLTETIHPDFSVIAIQYKSVILGGKMTREMKAAVKKVCAFLDEALEG